VECEAQPTKPGFNHVPWIAHTGDEPNAVGSERERDRSADSRAGWMRVGHRRRHRRLTTSQRRERTDGPNEGRQPLRKASTSRGTLSAIDGQGRILGPASVAVDAV